MDNYLFFIAWTSIGIQLMVPVAMASFGELISEKSGVLNIGIEGCMLIGAFSTAFIGIVYGSIFLGIMAGILSGFICGVILGIIFIWRNMDQIVSGLMFNLFAFGLTGTLHSSFLSGQMGPTLSSFGFVGTEANPLLQILSQQNLSFLVLLIIFCIVIFLIKFTWFGLHLNASGERPMAVTSSGKNVASIRFVSVIICCIFASLAGSILVATSSGGFVPGMTAGRGFIALGIVVLARWKPLMVLIASFIFGLTQALQFVGGQAPIFENVSPQLWTALPYLLIILLVIIIKGASYPKAVGIPLKKF